MLEYNQEEEEWKPRRNERLRQTISRNVNRTGVPPIREARVEKTGDPILAHPCPVRTVIVARS